MKGLVFYLLGTPRLERDSRPVEMDTRKAIALLAYLALTGKQQSRDTLAAFLWPDYSQTNARAALRRTLSALHRGLGAALLETGREVLNLPPGSGLWVDVNEFQRCLAQCAQHGHPANQVCPQCLPLLNEAARLYQGHFMAGFTLRDSVEFDDWQFQQSETLRRELAGALERLVQGHAAQGEYEAALGHAQRWLSLDHLHEPAHRQLMQLYTLADQHSAALRQYQVCVHILEKELGVSPLQETTQLYLDIKEQRGMWSPQAARQTRRKRSSARHQQPACRRAEGILVAAAFRTGACPRAGGAHPICRSGNRIGGAPASVHRHPARWLFRRIGG